MSFFDKKCIFGGFYVFLILPLQQDAFEAKKDEQDT
jgi:hypothetical protein